MLIRNFRPPHLAAMIPWEGAADFYRDVARHGGIFSNAFLAVWYGRQVLSIQHGNPSAVKDPWLNASASGADPKKPSTVLNPEQLESNRRDIGKAILDHPLDDEFHQTRSPDWSKVTVPFLSAANWAGAGLHPRGNFEAFIHAASKHKWLECHPGRHEEWFYLEQGIDIQKRFLDCFLKGADNGWMEEPPVLLRLRRAFDANNFEVRKEQEWPLASTKWTNVFLSADKDEPIISWAELNTASSVSFDALGKPLTFLSPPLESETEITGPLAAKLFASTSTTDMDLFVTFQAFSPEGKEVEFQGTVDPHTPLAQGWLRASHRKLDLKRSLPYRPYHSHDEILPVKPNDVYELDIEIWPTNIILPAGFRLALQISGKDFEREMVQNLNEPWVAKGSGPWLHTHPEDRPADVFGGRTTIYTGGKTGSRILLPIIPSAQ
jgi:predicted acyl esterase